MQQTRSSGSDFVSKEKASALANTEVKKRRTTES